MKIEDKLKLADIKDGKSALMWAQWRFDKEIISRSLNTVSNSFPHYSLHESSHSASILSEIEKILGEKVQNLSYVDCWLLLEAAYWHDTGMIITNDQKRSIIVDPEFRVFLEISKSSNGEMSNYATMFLAFTDGDRSIPFLEADNAFTFLLAEYIRRVHPIRSRKALENPQEIGVNTPQTGLINARLYSILGDIIECHGKDFDSVLELPFENDGLEAGDIAHPRFIACMLRLGDLLDLDDGRHCPTLLKTIGSLPPVSQAHLEKHRSIVSKTTNSFTIEIRAECSSYEAYEAQNDWLNYLEREIENQDKHWGTIAPKNWLGKLPTIKSLSCEMIGHIPLLSKASRLSIDSNRIYGYLSGNYIYKNPLAGIGEILQNAADATLKRLWLEHKEKIKDLQSFRQLAKEYPIKIDISVEKDDQTDHVIYHITIQDMGIGMSITDIRSLASIASKSRHQQQMKFAYKMPEWMRPSGYFGIGIQSAFSMTERLSISTKSPSDTGYTVVIQSSNGKTPSITVKVNVTDVYNFGTTVRFDISDAAIPSSFSGRSAVNRGLAEFDPLQDNILRVKEFQIEEQARDFAKYCDFPVVFKGSVLPSLSNQLAISDLEEGIEYAIEFNIDPHLCDWAFRGRPFKSKLNYKLFAIRGNIISGHADQFLPLDREELHDSGRKCLQEKINRSLKAKRDGILSKVTNKAVASLYYHIIGEDYDASWKEIEFSGIKISEILSPGNTFDFAIHAQGYMAIPEEGGVKVIKTNHGLIIDLLSIEGRGISLNSIRTVTPENTPFSGPLSTMQVFRITITASPKESSISEAAYEALSADKLSNSRFRYWVPCNADEYPDICIEAAKIDGWIGAITPFYPLFSHGILLPNSKNNIHEDSLFIANWLNERRTPLPIKTIQNSLLSFFDKFKFGYKDDLNIFMWD